MRLKTKLVLATSVFTVLLTATLCCVFFSQLLRGRVAQADAANVVLAHELLLSMRTALENDLAANAPTEPGEAAFERAITKTLQQDQALTQTIDAIVEYSPTVQDVFVSGANGRVLLSSNPAILGSSPPRRRLLSEFTTGGVAQQLQTVFGKPEVLDTVLPLERNGGPFLYAHIGVRSSLLRNAFAPWLREAALIGLTALGISLAAAVLLSSLAVRPIEQISRRLSALSAEPGSAAAAAAPQPRRDAVQEVSTTITRLDEQLRTSAQERTELASNLSQMLQTLKDGVLLLAADGTVLMASDSARNFLPSPANLTGHPIGSIFPADTAVGDLIRAALSAKQPLQSHATTLWDGRAIELSLNFPFTGTAGLNAPATGSLGAMLTLHDAAAQEEIEREIDLSRRLASIGRLTAGVGHEVKNPINAMVLHLELLRSKLDKSSAPVDGAGRHVDVLASEMARLDRVVQTLADFSRPLEPQLRERTIGPLIDSVLRLVSVDASLRRVTIQVANEASDERVLVDSEMLHQALLNIVLNAMDAMPGGGVLYIQTTRERGEVAIRIRDTGEGIAPELLDRVFHLYFTTKPTGSGIGLAMTWRMVQMMGGTVEVESDTVAESPTRGTLFAVRLPLATRQHGTREIARAQA